MPYDIESFKAAFGYPAGVVGKLAESLALKLESDPENDTLRQLARAADLQSQLLTLTTELKKLQEGRQDMISQVRARGLKLEIKKLEEDPELALAEGQLKTLQELYDLETQSQNAPPMLRGFSAPKIRKAKALLGVPDGFSTRLEGEGETETRPSVESVLRGGGKVELDKPVTGSDSRTYTPVKAIAGGGHSAYKIVDEEGVEFLWKPEDRPLMREVEVGASQLSSRLMGDLVPPCRKLSINGIEGTCQPFVQGVDDNVKVDQLTPPQQQQMVAHMLTDWLVSNHDNHLKQFLFDGKGNLIGIDKGQAFKFFKHGEVESSFVTSALLKAKNAHSPQERERHLRDVEPEDLDPEYFPGSNIGMPASTEFVRHLQRSPEEFDLDAPVIRGLIEKSKALKLEDLRELFGAYAREAFPGNEEAFLKAVLERAHGIDKQLEGLQLSAPALARHHLEVTGGLLDEEGRAQPGSSQRIGREVEQLRKAIHTLKQVEGIKTAEPPGKLHELRLQLERLEEAQRKLVPINEDCQAGENYLSGDYKRVGPLMAAFEELKVDPARHNDLEYSYDDIEGKLVERWKRIAVERSLVPPSGVEGWDKTELASTYEIVRKIARSWDAYPVPEIPGNRLARGDIAENLFANYPALDVVKKDLPDGEHAVSVDITWPSLMSTTVGDPVTHNFIEKKSFVWAFTVKQPCPGRIIGENNPSEQEVTFAPGVRVHVSQLIVRREDKTLQASTYGQNAMVIAVAELG